MSSFVLCRKSILKSLVFSMLLIPTLAMSCPEGMGNMNGNSNNNGNSNENSNSNDNTNGNENPSNGNVLGLTSAIIASASTPSRLFVFPNSDTQDGDVEALRVLQRPGTIFDYLLDGAGRLLVVEGTHIKIFASSDDVEQNAPSIEVSGTDFDFISEFELDWANDRLFVRIDMGSSGGRIDVYEGITEESFKDDVEPVRTIDSSVFSDSLHITGMYLSPAGDLYVGKDESVSSTHTFRVYAFDIAGALDGNRTPDRTITLASGSDDILGIGAMRFDDDGIFYINELRDVGSTLTGLVAKYQGFASANGNVSASTKFEVSNSARSMALDQSNRCYISTLAGLVDVYGDAADADGAVTADRSWTLKDDQGQGIPAPAIGTVID